MIIKLDRQKDDDISTVGYLSIDGVRQCVTLERGAREGALRISAGTHDVFLRELNTSRLDASYLGKFGRYPNGGMHAGMIEIGAPGREGILIHILNYPHETEGCIGPGVAWDQSPVPGELDRTPHFWIKASTEAYKKIYPIIRDALLKKVIVQMVVTDPADEPLVS